MLKAELRKAGFVERLGKGSHTVWTHALLAESLTLSGSDGDDARGYQEAAVGRLLGQLERARGQQ